MRWALETSDRSVVGRAGSHSVSPRGRRSGGSRMPREQGTLRRGGRLDMRSSRTSGDTPTARRRTGGVLASLFDVASGAAGRRLRAGLRQEDREEELLAELARVRRGLRTIEERDHELRNAV